MTSAARSNACDDTYSSCTYLQTSAEMAVWRADIWGAHTCDVRCPPWTWRENRTKYHMCFSILFTKHYNWFGVRQRGESGTLWFRNGKSCKSETQWVLLVWQSRTCLLQKKGEEELGDPNIYGTRRCVLIRAAARVLLRRVTSLILRQHADETCFCPTPEHARQIPRHTYLGSFSRGFISAGTCKDLNCFLFMAQCFNNMRVWAGGSYFYGFSLELSLVSQPIERAPSSWEEHGTFMTFEMQIMSWLSAQERRT